MLVKKPEYRRIILPRKWEYKELRFKTTARISTKEKILNELGREEWKVIQIEYIETAGAFYYTLEKEITTTEPCEPSGTINLFNPNN